MQMYLNDSVKSFEFVLQVFVDVSALTTADAGCIELLCRLTRSGARLRAPRPPQSEEFLRSLGVLVVTPPWRPGRPWILGVRRLFGLSV